MACTCVSTNLKILCVTDYRRAEQLQKLSALCLANARALLQSVEYCASQGIGGFTTDPDIVKNSVEELEYQAQAAELIGADVINIHAGGGYGNKPLALQRMSRVVRQLSPAVLERLTLENDDRTYTPADLVAFCHEHNIPLVYDVHHHRCLPDGLSVQAATEAALKTWRREPLFHISSPKDGWKAKDPRPHHDYIDIHDFPREWRSLNITIEIEAKAKELAVVKLRDELNK